MRRIRFATTTPCPRFVIGRVQRIPDLSCLQDFMCGWEATAQTEFDCELTALDYLQVREIYPVGRHKLCTVAMARGDAQRAVVTHLPDGRVRCRFYEPIQARAAA